MSHDACAVVLVVVGVVVVGVVVADVVVRPFNSNTDDSGVK